MELLQVTKLKYHASSYEPVLEHYQLKPQLIGETSIPITFYSNMKCLRVVVSGAAGLIGYQLSGLLVSVLLSFHS